jgi:hypothetical protein
MPKFASNQKGVRRPLELFMASMKGGMLAPSSSYFRDSNVSSPERPTVLPLRLTVAAAINRRL